MARVDAQVREVELSQARTETTLKVWLAVLIACATIIGPVVSWALTRLAK